MPRASHQETIARQWELLKFLPSRPPGRTSNELRNDLAAAGYPVTKRTVERNLVELSLLFPIDCNDKSIPYGWHWMPGAQLKIPGIDLAEAVSLGLMQDLLRQLVPPIFSETLEGRFAQADEKLRSLPRNPFAKWTDLVRYVPPEMPFHPPSLGPGVMQTVLDSLLKQRQIGIRYKSPQGEPKEHVLHPLGLFHRGVRTYLLADRSGDDARGSYALHRITDAELLDAPSRRPKSFSLDRFLAEGGAQFGGGKRITLKARLDEKLATILHETPISEDQKITTRRGVHTLTASVFDSWQLEFWIQSCSCLIEVREPKSLRKKTISLLQKALDHYKPQKKVSKSK